MTSKIKHDSDSESSQHSEVPVWAIHTTIPDVRTFTHNEDQFGSLPEGWERHMSPRGRIFYLDLNTRRTTLIRPLNSNAPKGQTNTSELPRQMTSAEPDQSSGDIMINPPSTTDSKDLSSLVVPFCAGLHNLPLHNVPLKDFQAGHWVIGSHQIPDSRAVTFNDVGATQYNSFNTALEMHKRWSIQNNEQLETDPNNLPLNFTVNLVARDQHINITTSNAIGPLKLWYSFTINFIGANQFVTYTYEANKKTNAISRSFDNQATSEIALTCDPVSGLTLPRSGLGQYPIENLYSRSLRSTDHSLSKVPVSAD